MYHLVRSYDMICTCTIFAMFSFWLGDFPLQSVWSLSCRHGLGYASYRETNTTAVRQHHPHTLGGFSWRGFLTPLDGSSQK